MMKKIRAGEPMYHKVVFIYTLLFAIYTLFGRVTVLHNLVEHTINSYVFILAGLMGILLFGVDLLFYRNFLKMKYVYVYIAFIVVAAISSVLNMTYGIKSNLTTLVWLVDQMIVFTTMGYLFTRENYDAWLRWFFRVSGVIWGIAAGGSIYQYFFVPGFKIWMNGRFIRQSFCENRLFGVFIDPNLGAFVGFLVMWGMFYLIRDAKKRESRHYKLVQVLGIINCILQTFYIILSGSRSVEVCMVVSLSYAIIFYFMKKNREKQIPLWKKALTYVLVPLVISFALLACFEGIKIGVATLAQNVTTETSHTVDELERTDIEGNASNNRSDIWKGYIELWKDKPIFGISPRNGWTYADAVHPEGYIANHHYDVHNAYIAVFVGMGIVGTLVMLLLIFLLLKSMLQQAFDVKTLDITKFMAIQMILNIAVFICFYPGIYFTNGIDTVLFWPAVGYIMKEQGKNS